MRFMLMILASIPSGKIPGYAIDDLLPGRLYTKNEMLDCLESCRQKCKSVIFSLTEESLEKRWIDHPDELAGDVTLKYSVLEILLYNLKHVQHHAGQLNLLLRQETGEAANWVADAQDK